MKINDKLRKDVQEFLKAKGTPCNAFDVAFHLMPQWKTIYTENICDTLRAVGFPVIGYMVYDLDE